MEPEGIWPGEPGRVNEPVATKLSNVGRKIGRLTARGSYNLRGAATRAVRAGTSGRGGQVRILYVEII